ncbi:hypothetical protein GCM10011511_56290 [Puia dinghuensis]|uniref:Uncharacterized protein n=1 Tax=Puia dinghuensis TaxID=1792502 RepID=A0A8J2UIZ0_9BACT|nr:hypothetical protein GCM10011511_56290 [Puia dinghuensis]
MLAAAIIGCKAPKNKGNSILRKSPATTLAPKPPSPNLKNPIDKMTTYYNPDPIDPSNTTDCSKAIMKLIDSIAPFKKNDQCK